MAESLRETERDLFGVYSDEIQGGLCIRLVEERLLYLFKEGKLFGTVHTCIGQEFSGIAVCRSLQAQVGCSPTIAAMAIFWPIVEI